MLRLTIAKFSGFVIFAAVATACDIAPLGAPAADSPYATPEVVGTIKATEITESSGLAASRCNSGVFWTHNDSGDDAIVFAISKKGDVLGTWKVDNAVNHDWEDIATYKDAAAKCWLYIGEIGDNKLRRPVHSVYRLPEPRVAVTTPSNVNTPITAAGTEVLDFAYPDRNQDAETLMVEPRSGDIYVLTKQVSGPSGVYRLKGAFGQGHTQTAEHVADLSVPAVPNGFLTGGDISPDGRRVIVCDYRQAYELVLPEGAQRFDDIWQATATGVQLGKRDTGEAVCYGVDGMSIFATSERKNSPVIEVRRK